MEFRSTASSSAACKPHFTVSAITMMLLLSLLLTPKMGRAADKPTILVWGDSLSAAYGFAREQGWVNLMRNALGDEVKIINGSISGETTSGGLTRLPAALKRDQPDIVILELGANDGLRGFQPSQIQTNLQKMIDLSIQSGAQVILLGMKIPPNYGPIYAAKFEGLYEELAKQNSLTFLPFFMESIIDKLDLLQEDELHPKASAQPMLLDQVLPKVKETLSHTEAPVSLTGS